MKRLAIQRTMYTSGNNEKTDEADHVSVWCEARQHGI